MKKYIRQLFCLAALTLASTHSQASSFKQYGAAMIGAYICQAAVQDDGLPSQVSRTFELMRSAMIYTNDILPLTSESLKQDAADRYRREPALVWLAVCDKWLSNRDWDIYMDITSKFEAESHRMSISYRFIHAQLACQKFYQLLSEMRDDTRHKSTLSEYMQGQTDEKWAAIDRLKAMHADKLKASRVGQFASEEHHQYWAAQLVDVGLHFSEMNWLGQYTVSTDGLSSNLSNMTRTCIRFLDLPDR